jgi:catecholate siderophore receptor
MTTALADYSRQAEVDVSFDSVMARRTRSNPVRGTLRSPEALRSLLAGTGLTARFVDARSVIVRSAVGTDSAARSLRRVVITGSAPRHSAYDTPMSSTAMKTGARLRDTPQSVTVVTRGLIADQAMQSMADLVRYVPGVTMAQGEGHRDAPVIRGNTSTADFFVDGVRDDAQYLRDLYNVDRVEVLKGSNAMIFGRGGGGGVINRVNKEASWLPVRSITLEGGSFDHQRGTVDVGRGLGRRVAARLNGMYDNSGAFRDAVSLERYGVNPTVAFIPTARTMMRLGYELFQDRRTVDRGIPSFRDRPSDAAITTFFGDPDASHAVARVHAAGALVEHATTIGLTLRNRTQVVHYDKFYQNVFAGSAVNAVAAQVNLAAYNNATARTNLFNQTDLTYALATGRVVHTLLLGAEFARQRTNNFRNTGFFENGTTALAVPFDAPTVTSRVSFRQSATDADNNVLATTAALYVHDRIDLSRRWQAIVGVRRDRFAVGFHNNRTAEDLARTDHLVSPRAGLVFKPAERMSLYASRGVSYLPSSGDQFSSLTATSRTLEPERFVNNELGAKWDIVRDLSFSAAAYRLDRSNTTAKDPNDPARTVQTGRQRTAGYELGLTGNVTRMWQVAGGWASQRATITSATTAAKAGATVPLVPHQTFSLWNRVQTGEALGIGLGVIHQTASYAAIDNSVTLPAFTRADAALYVRLVRGVRTQVNIENLLDARYYATSQGNNNIMPGATRTVRLSLAADFR